MATEIDAALFSKLIKNQINVGRYSEQQARDMVSLLNAADADIAAKLLKWGESQRYSPARLRAILAEIKVMVADVYGEAADTLKTEMVAFAEHAAEVAAATIATQMPLEWKPFGLSKQQLAAIISNEPIMVGAESKLLFGEIFQGLAGAHEKAIRGALRLSMAEGESIMDATTRLTGTMANSFKDGIFEKGRRDMGTIARTVINHVSNRAAQGTFAENSDVLNGWIFTSTLDGKTSITCRSLSGTKWKLGEGPIPPRHLNCRSFQTPDIKTFRQLGIDRDEMPISTRASSGGQIRSDISMDEWMRSQSKSEVAEMLGPTRAKLFWDGKLKIEKFANERGVTYTLDQLKKRNSALFKKVF